MTWLRRTRRDEEGMAKAKWLCTACENIFEGDTALESLSCPKCQGIDVQKLNVLTSDAVDANGPPAWEFICQVCKSYFEAPVPRGPDEAKNIRCPGCKSRILRRYNAMTIECYVHSHG
jgi:DNA-directed RNA polymerase subunit RPC12/RpoP